MLLAAGDRPALFLGPELDAAVIGFIADDVPLELAGATDRGRVPVRIDGALRARGYVPEELLALRVQRRGRVRGTPVYVAPDDHVQVLGRDAVESNRLRVRVTARSGESALASYEGTYPAEGLAAQPAAAGAEPPDRGTAAVVPAGMELVLRELPGGAEVARVAPQGAAYEVRLVNAQGGHSAVRVGSGPYLVGWTDAGLIASGDGGVELALTSARSSGDGGDPGGGVGSFTSPSTFTSTSTSTTPSAGVRDVAVGAALPRQIADEAGELRRVVPGAKVVFGQQVIGVLRAAGWARVMTSYPSGWADVFVAADDGVALRGLVRSVDLLPVTETSTPAGAR